MRRAPLDGSNEPSWQGPHSRPLPPQRMCVKSPSSSRRFGSAIPAIIKRRRRSCHHPIKCRDNSKVTSASLGLFMRSLIPPQHLPCARLPSLALLSPQWECNLHAVLLSPLRGGCIVSWGQSEMAGPRGVMSSFWLPQ